MKRNLSGHLLYLFAFKKNKKPEKESDKVKVSFKIKKMVRRKVKDVGKNIGRKKLMKESRMMMIMKRR